ncbi:hypothetical protein JQ597_22620 [Bradyrhizobium sp. AUGA SZCCT0177]|uniref:hypothetical protein n=1 Tax=Bradyrhizobium sp. AUGA SZCCT0177 TaxID=2807665 RepID=UPI001BA785DE|nr:hypothetical protein [Bradyrhizobium sp. AUGA SZCCT0177]MBR1284846.1 hypothetical protein [Bradyrhizobium sp. AUGA SZCCT0177]
MKVSAESTEAQNTTAAGTASAEAVNMIRELRDAAREIPTSQEYPNSKISF